MTGIEPQQSNKNQEISPLIKDPTYGERVHDFVFNNLINFWVNLTVSAAFTYYVNHSLKEVKLPWLSEAKRPAQLQKELGQWIRKAPFMNLFKNEATKDDISGNMAGVLTLTAAGHLVMIPSVWIGAKVKAPMVRALNRMHYGAEAMDDPTLKTRHAAIEAEERPTLLGATVGRLGTIAATQTAAYTLGSSVNLIKWLGEKTPLKFLAHFNGIDNMTSQLGDNIGGAVTDMMPKRMEKVNKAAGKTNGFSLRQLEQHPEIATLAYGDKTASRHGGGVAEHYGKYFFSDIMYSAVTAVTIAPAIDLLKKFIPGLTYKPDISREERALLDSHGKPRMRGLADRPTEAPAAAAHAPGLRVSAVETQDRVATAHAMGVPG